MVAQLEPRTFRIVGELGRVDERRTPHPMMERGEFGERARRWRHGPANDPFVRIFNSGRATDPWNAMATLFTEAPEGKVNPVATPVPDPAKMSRQIKEVARFFGADAVGIALLDQAYVYTHRARGSQAEGTKAGDPVTLDHKYAICMGLAGDNDRYVAGPSSISDAEYSMGNTRSMIPAFMLAAYIRELGYPARWHAYHRMELNPLPLAIRAGLGELGRNGMLIHEKYGSRLHLMVVTTDLPLVVDAPVDIAVEEFCRYCKKCARTCPSRSITFSDVKDVYKGVEKWRINVDSCYLNRVALDHNCLYCTTSCCYNKKPGVWYHTLAMWLLKATPLRLRPLVVRPLVWMDDLFWGQRPHAPLKWLDYDSDPPDGACEVSGCVALHRPQHRKRLQRPGREAPQRLFPSDELRAAALQVNGKDDGVRAGSASPDGARLRKGA